MSEEEEFHEEQREENEAESQEVEETPHRDYETLAHGTLSPRHRRLAQLASLGSSNSQIAKELGYSESRVSILLRNPYILEEITRLQNRIFEETIQQRLKSFAEPALNNIQWILTDKTNKVKTSEKADMSRWVVEKLDGKAVQKHDVGENLLSVMLDKLDAQGRGTRPVTEVVETQARQLNAVQQKAPEEPKTEEEQLDQFLDDFYPANET